MRLSDINNKEISITLTDFELAKPEDNTPEKLAERARQYKQESERPPISPEPNDPHDDVSDVKPLSRVWQPKILPSSAWQTLDYDFSKNTSMHIKASVSEIMQTEK